MNSYFPLYCDFRRGVSPRVVWARASAGTRLQASGVWRETPASTPRLHHAADGSPLGVLLEPAATNLSVNPRVLGVTPGVIGSGGAFPTSWAVDGGGGLTHTAIASGEMRGLRYYEFRVQGVATGTFFIVRTLSSVAASAGQTYSTNSALAFVGGSFAGINAVRSGISGTGAPGIEADVNAASLTAESWHFAGVNATTAVGTTAVSHRAVNLLYSIGASIDVTLRVAAPMLVQAGVISTLVLPAPATTGASTRAADSGVIPLRDFLMANAGPGVTLVAFRAAPGVSAAAQPIASISDGTADNRVLITREVGRTIRAEVFVGGVSQGSVTSVATVADNADAVVTVRFGAGDLALSLDGAAVVTAAPASIPASMTQLDLLAHGGSTARIGFRPTVATAPTNADLQTLSRQGPIA